MTLKFSLRSSYVVCVIVGHLLGYLAFTVASPSSFKDKSFEFTGPSPIADHATCSDWASWVPPRTDPAVVLQVVSEDYVDLQRNFMRLMERNSVFTRHNMYLMCMDDVSVTIFAAMGIRCVPLGGLPFNTFRQIWGTRIRALSCLVTEGYDVIMSDSDALWLRNPMEYFYLPSVRSSSVVASRGNLPSILSDSWGATMCMGFILFRATGPGMDKLQRSMGVFFKRTGDDQVAANQAISELGISWDEDSDMRLTKSTGLGRGTIDTLSGDGGPFVVTLLPHSVFTRQCASTPLSNDTVVAHCFTKKRVGTRIAWMQKANLWLLDNKSP